MIIIKKYILHNKYNLKKYHQWLPISIFLLVYFLIYNLLVKSWNEPGFR